MLRCRLYQGKELGFAYSGNEEPLKAGVEISDLLERLTLEKIRISSNILASSLFMSIKHTVRKCKCPIIFAIVALFFIYGIIKEHEDVMNMLI